MSLLKVRQRYSFSQVVYGPGIEVESQQQLPQLHNVEILDLLPVTPTVSSPRAPTVATLWLHRLENLLWIASAAFIVYYGDFRCNLFVLLISDPRIRRAPLILGLAGIVIDLGIFLYVAVRLRNSKRIEERLEIIAPGAIPPAAMIGLSAFILLSFALWPIWKFLTLPMLFTLFMAFVVVAPYFVPYVNVKLDADGLRGLSVRSTE